MTHRVIICGPRDWPENLIPWLHEQLDSIFLVEFMFDDPLIVHGDCPHFWKDVGETIRRWSVDSLVQEWAEKNGVPTERHPADWSKGYAAGPFRNNKMAALDAPLCVAFRESPTKKTYGTNDMVACARGRSIPVRELSYASSSSDLLKSSA